MSYKDHSPEQHRIRELEQELEIKNEILASLEEILDKYSQNSSGHGYREIEQENMMFKELLESIEGKSSSEVEQFFSMISHELKTPLVPIQGYVKMLKEERFGKLDEIQKEKLGLIDSNTTSLVKIIQDMLDFQKLSVGSLEMKKEEHSLEEIVKASVDSIQAQITQKRIDLTIQIDSSIKLVGDFQRLCQVLLNILENSICAIDSEQGMISIIAKKENGTIKILIQDNGCGIAPEHLDKIFSKYYQVDMSNTREKGGIGLGLAISKKIVEIHNGNIWAESKVGKGTILNLIFPEITKDLQ